MKNPKVKSFAYFRLQTQSATPFQDWVVKGNLNPFHKKRDIQIKIDVDPLSLF